MTVRKRRWTVLLPLLALAGCDGGNPTDLRTIYVPPPTQRFHMGYYASSDNAFAPCGMRTRWSVHFRSAELEREFMERYRKAPPNRYGVAYVEWYGQAGERGNFGPKGDMDREIRVDSLHRVTAIHPKGCGW